MPFAPEIQRKFDELEKRVRMLEQEVRSGDARMQIEIRQQISGLISGIQRHVDAAVSAAVNSALEPFLERLKKIDHLPDIAENVAALTEAAQEARDYRVSREAREKAEKEFRERLAAEDAHNKARADVDFVKIQAAAYPVESVWRRRAPVLVLAGVVLAALASLAVAAMNSH